MCESWKYSDDNFYFAVTRVMMNFIDDNLSHLVGWRFKVSDNNLSLCSGLVTQKQRSSRTRAKLFLELRQAIIIYDCYNNICGEKFQRYPNNQRLKIEKYPFIESRNIIFSLREIFESKDLRRKTITEMLY